MLEGYTIVNELMGTEGKVPVQVIYPEGYDAKRAEKYPVIFYQCGGGVCYWELTDTTQAGVYAPATNLGDNTVYDVMMTKWHEAFPEAIIMSVNVPVSEHHPAPPRKSLALWTMQLPTGM